MVNMKKLVGQGELGGLMVRLMMALQEQITRSRSFSAVATCQNPLRQASLDLVRSVFSPEKGIRLVGVTVSNFNSVTMRTSFRRSARTPVYFHSEARRNATSSD